jgi:glycopeptide antibiotics resistance protein
VTIQNFYINKEEKTVNIISADKKLLTYSALTGELIGTKGITSESMMILDGIILPDRNTAFCEMGPKFNLSITDGKSIKHLIPFNEIHECQNSVCNIFQK